MVVVFEVGKEFMNDEVCVEFGVWFVVFGWCSVWYEGDDDWCYVLVDEVVECVVY